MANYIFAYSINVWTTKGKSVPSGGAFCAQGARNVIKRILENGFKVSEIFVQMHYDDRPLDWSKPISQRRILFHNSNV